MSHCSCTHMVEKILVKVSRPIDLDTAKVHTVDCRISSGYGIDIGLHILRSIVGKLPRMAVHIGILMAEHYLAIFYHT